MKRIAFPIVLMLLALASLAQTTQSKTFTDFKSIFDQMPTEFRPVDGQWPKENRIAGVNALAKITGGEFIDMKLEVERISDIKRLKQINVSMKPVYLSWCGFQVRCATSFSVDRSEAAMLDGVKEGMTIRVVGKLRNRTLLLNAENKSEKPFLMFPAGGLTDVKIIK